MFGINKNGTKHKIGIIMPAFFPASRTTYDGTSSGLSATDVQDAIDEVEGNIPDMTNVAYKNVNNSFSANQTVDTKEGTTTSTGQSFIIAGNNTAEGTAGNSKGILRLWGKGSKYTNLLASNATDDRTIELPDKSGTVALMSDVPTVTKVTQSVEVTANSVNTTTLSFGSIPASKILMVQVTWSNSVNDVPVSLVCYSSNATYVNRVVHQWSVAQTVNFRIHVLHLP